MEEIKKIVTEMIEELQPYEEFDETTNLLGEDVLDSVSVLVLVQELEEEFSITIQADEITGENFETVVSIAELIKAKQM